MCLLANHGGQQRLQFPIGTRESVITFSIIVRLRNRLAHLGM